jgi:hypothetical protein
MSGFTQELLRLGEIISYETTVYFKIIRGQDAP